jgi:acetoin utilization deacetylase AcuC-like enzyme
MLKVAYSPIYHHPLPEGHRFPMDKYSLLPEQLVYEGTITNENLFNPRNATVAEILSVHSEDYWNKLKGLQLTRSEERRTGFPLTDQLVEREIKIAGGTIQCTEFALKYGCSLNVAGGTHHAFTDRGEGFCLLNDIAIGAAYLLSNKRVSRILVIDLDVHQGNGTAEIFENNSQVFTFSMHGKKNYPLHKERSDLDVELEDGIEDDEYLDILTKNLSSIDKEFKPQFVFYQSGVDVLATDKLGRMGLTMNGCKERDRIVFEYCKEKELPVVVTMGGGYSKEVSRIIEAHANTYRQASSVFF